MGLGWGERTVDGDVFYVVFVVEFRSCVRGNTSGHPCDGEVSIAIFEKVLRTGLGVVLLGGEERRRLISVP